MTEKTADESSGLDDLSRLQKRLEDLGTKFCSCIGVLQRDAPPATRPPEESEEIPNDEIMRRQLETKTPEFARDIIQTSRDIDAIITEIEGKMALLQGKERTLLDTANFESLQAGDEMTEAVDDAQKLLTSIRQITAARETEP
eukprot:GFKZ01013089.1.p3 GENE.GFKZ01013089.1~~GFKZ01013089.1.p3  ORF type:complete len:143 (+),score=24.26 GFKZ01013089.1:216-644(+)